MINVTQTFCPPLEDYMALLEGVWESKWLTNRGSLVCLLEEKLRAYLQVADLLLVCNGTLALQIAIKTLELTGDVISTPFSYVATASSLVWEGCNPVFVDIDPEHLTIDESKIEDAITTKTTAILATHVYGNPCDVEAIDDIARRHNLKVIYDAAHCFGVRYRGKSILNWGDVSTLSFHATKVFHTGEGGAIVSNNADLAPRIFYHHNFGHHGEDKFWGLGINGKMSELNAAMGLALLPFIDDLLDKRRRVCEFYDAALASRQLRKPMIRRGTDWNYSYYPVIFPSESALVKAQRALNVNDIYPRRYFYPSLNNLPYIEKCVLPVADDLSRRILCLPLSAEIKQSELQRICEILEGEV